MDEVVKAKAEQMLKWNCESPLLMTTNNNDNAHKIPSPPSGERVRVHWH
jgi:hypothetical protein